MTEAGKVYGEALYDLSREEGLSASILTQLDALETAFAQEPEYIRLLSSPALTKAERCRILDSCFRGRVHPYVLNFLKILTGKGYMRHFSDCCETFTQHYNQDNGILPVTVTTAVSLTVQQAERLVNKLVRITGKQIQLKNRIDAGVLGGMRLDYDGRRLDDTAAHRLTAIREMLETGAAG